MSEGDPEAYKRFISEQLEAGKSSMLQEKSQQESAGSKTGNPLESLEKVMGKLSLSAGAGVIPSKTGAGSGTGRKMTAQKNANGANKPVKSSGGDNNEVIHLLDDEIAEKSMLSSIVKKCPSSTADDQDDEDSGVAIRELRIPSMESVPVQRARKKNAPLIEEI